ncbi:alpha-L-fucosidase 2 precursor, putative [Talaromyces stipitatus ATCC 10500]|uniref:Alpha-L-fucosidase 2, putative n=1 Tax=Talaromyces stipitatus (strain ATCC 10500 / CBS 375.48 / QM 6759 / NRRL 1006) TaxID=441959 RepID=B8MP90_TALSN|nr:alpha-L-fucosidase 2 precursor, putative [Talaromyces stipitatus ATCC 10500]EED14329.1 alpha-L-fucosidase 2 precursor, putative [Talaromyces stipitatus ATCC 10500]
MTAYKLWYDQPAQKWQDGLPIGNGHMGAVIISQPSSEIWSFNNISFWSGRSESTPVIEYGGREALDKIRKEYFADNYEHGKRLTEKYLQPEKGNYGTNLMVARIYLALEHGGEEPSFTDFRRELNLDEAIVRTEYKSKSVLFRREVFASYPHQVLMARLRTECLEGMNLKLGVSGVTKEFSISDGETTDCLVFETQAVEEIHSNGTCGVRGRGIVQAHTVGGSVHIVDGELRVKNASEVIIKVSFQTDFRSLNDDWKLRVQTLLDNVWDTSYEELRALHVRDYQSLYRRVHIDLGHTEDSNFPLNKRKASFQKSGYNDPSLYLTISGTRATSPLPLHLQGIWNDGEANAMNWSCDYHLDINTQMNYFPTETTNLGDLQGPLMRYCEYLASSGKKSARNFYGAGGWVAHVFSNVWGYTDPGWETSWGLNITGGLWMATHMIEHYEYSLDRNFLTTQAYPVLREAAEFFLDYMTIDPRTGYLVTGPSNSPENSFYPSTQSPREKQELSLGPTIDITLVRDLFKFCIFSVDELGLNESEFAARVHEALAKLPPFRIGKRGQLQEWFEDYEEAQPDHRHLSHIIGLCRSDQISRRHTPELADAVQVTLACRQEQADLEDIEFTAALLGLAYARLNDGGNAFKQIAHLIYDLSFDNLLTYSKPGIAGAETTIFVADGNYGGTAVIAEMLIRSLSRGKNGSEIELLPALPTQWATGSVKGLRARGNIEIDIEWAEGTLVMAVLRSLAAGIVTVFYENHTRTLDMIEGGTIRLDGQVQLM